MPQDLSQDQLHKIEQTIGISFKSEDLLKQVFIHRSFLNEHPNFKLDNNERLEFLGDAVLELVVTKHLYKNFDQPEGVLTNWRAAIVRGERLAQTTKKLSLGKFLLMSNGELQSGGQESPVLLANLFEALVGAIYLEHGLDKAQQFIKKVLLVQFGEILEKKLYLDPKTQLQEKIQSTQGVTPVYQVISQSGPDHDKHFLIGVYISKSKIGQGEGKSKQKAEQQAAQNALENLNFKARPVEGTRSPLK